MEAQPPGIGHQKKKKKKETVGLGKLETIGLYHTSLRSLHQEHFWVLVGERWGQ